MKIAVIGAGSAAQRIIKILLEINNKYDINVYTNKKQNKFKNNINLLKIKKKNIFTEDLFFIANNTADHFKFLSQLIKLNKDIYVEKPICSNLKEIKFLKNNLKKSNSKVMVGYQFRENH